MLLALTWSYHVAAYIVNSIISSTFRSNRVYSLFEEQKKNALIFEREEKQQQQQTIHKDLLVGSHPKVDRYLVGTVFQQLYNKPNFFCS